MSNNSPPTITSNLRTLLLGPTSFDHQNANVLRKKPPASFLFLSFFSFSFLFFLFSHFFLFSFPFLSFPPFLFSFPTLPSFYEHLHLYMHAFLWILTHGLPCVTHMAFHVSLTWISMCHSHGFPCVTHMAFHVSYMHVDTWLAMCHSTLVASKDVKF